jgi:hypothetical protein
MTGNRNLPSSPTLLGRLGRVPAHPKVQKMVHKEVRRVEGGT